MLPNYNKFLFLLIVAITFSCKLQKGVKYISQTECDTLFFDLNTGMINFVSPRLQPSEIKEWFTCYTSIIPEGVNSNCGGGVIYDNHGFKYYTYSNFVEVNQKFKGKLSSPILGTSRNNASTSIGRLMETYQRPEYPNNDFYLTEYGCLRLDYTNGTVIAVSSHFNHCESVDVCNP